MTRKLMTLISSAILVLAITGPAVAADVTGAATDAVKKKATEEVQKQAPGAVTTPAADPTKAVKGAAQMPADPTKAVTGTAEDMAKKKAAEAAQGVVK
ncbi:MAG: hypothetical protein F9K25_05910 [Candidatus Contendobacter sp.]|nr:MAG: hypothetical protein F9K25_05910 [Candidatus Contendobacter sp.]